MSGLCGAGAWIGVIFLTLSIRFPSSAVCAREIDC